MHHAAQPADSGRTLATPLTCPQLAKHAGIRHGFFTRSGGVSHGAFTSLNCAYGTGDSDANVQENIRRAIAALGAETYCKAYQVHSATALIATAPWGREDVPQGDAIVTASPGLAVAVTTADCVPILLADSENRVIAAVHAGWKGALGGIVEATLKAMQELGANLPSIQASIGPSIAQGSYEVGAGFKASFLEQDDGNQIYFIHGVRDGHYLFDLKAYVKDRLRNAGLSAINLLAHDTCLQEDDFFSYRRATLRGESAYGCQLSAIVLE